MILSTTETVAGMEVAETLGLVAGSSVRSRNFLRDIGAWLKNLLGGEIGVYTEMLQEARDQALVRMIEAAQKKGADGVVNVRLATSAIMRQAAEVMAYGTAVRLRRIGPS